MYLAQSSDRLLLHGWSVVIFRKNIKRPWGCADKLQQMFRCSTSKNLNYRWPRSFVVDLCDFPSCLHQEWKLNVDCVCHVAVMLALLVFRFYWCVTWRSGQVLGKEEGKNRKKRQNGKTQSEAPMPSLYVTVTSWRRPSWPSPRCGACLRGGRSPHHALGRASYNFHLFSCTWLQVMQNVSKCYDNVQQSSCSALMISQWGPCIWLANSSNWGATSSQPSGASTSESRS